MNKANGWKPLPTALKFIFIIEVIGVILSLFRRQGLDYIFGIPIPTIPAAILYYLIIIVGSLILLLAFWERYKWTWTYSWVYFGILMLNALITAATNFSDTINTLQTELQVPVQVAYFSLSLGIAIGIGINALFLWLIYRNKKYFE
ncbi:MAG TPA: hypothetical protein VJI98_02350 [Candidatus Nanoarchaeia archaeon]|nr:hypothetical protein [Candidatus Nanoarchaeia archaeon]